MVMGLLSPRGSQFTTTIVAGTGNAMIERECDACLFGVLLPLLRSRDRFRVREPGISRVDVVLLFCLISSVAGSFSFV